MADGFLPPVIATLTADISAFSAKMGEAKAEMDSLATKGESTGTRLASLGGSIAKGLVVGAAGIGAVAVKMAGDFQQSITRLATDAGESTANLKMVGDGILDLSGKVGISANNLAKGMYYVESAGFHGADALNILKTASEGAVVGNSDLTTTTSALTSVMDAYRQPVQAATGDMNELIAIVSHGKLTLQDLSGALGTVIPSAAALNVPLSDVGGALATMTQQGTDANRAATYLRFALASMAGPTSKASDILKTLGLSSQDTASYMNDTQRELESLGVKSSDVANTLTHQGLVPALKMVTDAVGKQFPEGSSQYLAALSKMFGGTRGLQGVLELTGTNMQAFAGNVQAVAAGATNAGSHVEGWSLIQQNFNQKMREWEATAGEVAIKLGSHLIPIIENFAHKIWDVTKFLSDHKAVLEAVAGVVGGVLSVAVGAFVVNKMAAFVTSVKSAIDITRNFLSAIASLASRIAAGMGFEQQSAQLGALSAALSTNTAETEANTAATEANAASHEADTAAVESSVAPMAASEAAAGGLAGELGGAGEAAGGLTAGLGGAGLLGVLGPAALGIGLVGGAMYLMSQHSGGAVANVDFFTKALAAAGTQSGQSAAQIEAAAFGASDFGKRAADLGANLGQFTGFLQGNTKDVTDVGTAFQQTAFHGGNFDKKLQQMAASGNQFAQTLLSTGQTMNGPLILGLNSAAQATDLSTAADRRKQQALNGVKLSSDQVVQSLQAQITKEQEAQNTSDQLDSAYLQGQSNMLAVKQAQDDLSQATANYGPNSLEAQQAQIALSQATLQTHGNFALLSTALINQVGDYAKNSGSVQEFKQHQFEMVQKLQATAGQLGLTQDQVNELTQDILKVPPGANVEFSTNAPQVIASINGITNAIRGVANAAGGGVSAFIASHTNGGNALGGPLSPGITPVGEDGMELMYWDGRNAPYVISNPSTPGGNFGAVASGPSVAASAVAAPSAGGGDGAVTPLILQLDGAQLARVLWPHLQTETLQRGRVGQKLVAVG